MDIKEIEEKAYKILEKYIEKLGYEVILIEFTKDRNWTLRIYIDKPDGVTIEDCVKVSELIDPLLDVEDFISGRYNLEVSSPGLNRPLRKIEHFKNAINEKVKINVTEPFEENNRHNYKGILKNVDDDKIFIETKKDEIKEIPINLIKKANLIYKF